MFKIFLFFVALLFNSSLKAQNNLVQQQQNNFVVNGKPVYFLGANMWYANLLGMPDNKGGNRNRLMNELDFLKLQGITNIRVLIGAQGQDKLVNGVNPVHPAMQIAPGEYDRNLFEGMDFLVQQLQKRNMVGVFFFSNNWEWSGGFLQYLNWHNQLDDASMAQKMNWDDQQDITSKFYSCSECKNDYWDFVKMVLSRSNTLTGKKYIDEPAIMAWEVANEPRPMRPAAIPAYKDFLLKTTALIKKVDPHHLLTLGVEGFMGTENLKLFEEIHTDPNVNYATIHIWPKNWGWYKDSSFKNDFSTVLQKTASYINMHDEVMMKIKKPLVIEEFGMPRDGFSFSPNSTVEYRNGFYELILQKMLESKKAKTTIAGINFWSFAGFGIPAKNETVFWKEGDDLIGDPPMEEQGLNAVFASDSSTWALLKKYDG